jgi:parallel beta-helix repeat protein
MRIRVVLFVVLAASCSLAATIRVPKNQPTIEDAINAANDGDTVLVAPGTYKENINFLGKAITVKSSSGAKITIIDGAKQGSVVSFDSDESSKSVLRGFTIRNGDADNKFGLPEGGGIVIVNASPTIRNNVVTENTACEGGAGIALIGGAPLIQENTISKNSQSPGCFGGSGGGGMYIAGGTGAQILRNKIIGNSDGGIEFLSAGSPLLEDNIIANNSGAAIGIQNDSSPVIVQNLIYSNGNQATVTGGIYLSPSYGTAGTIIVSNTMVNNKGSQGSDLFAGGFDSNSQIINNLFVSTHGLNVVYCDPTYENTPPAFTFNDAFTSGTPLEGSCAGEIGTNGNISTNPRFVNLRKHHYQLTKGSPAINAGTNSAPDLPAKDFAGHPRIVGGTVDIGAYEYQGGNGPTARSVANPFFRATN